MKTVFVTTKEETNTDKLASIQEQIDFSFVSLLEFAQQLDNIIIGD